jgi:hypothetical protein
MTIISYTDESNNPEKNETAKGLIQSLAKLGYHTTPK